MSKSLKRHRITGNDEYSDHKIKAMKKREVERKLARLEDEDYMDDDESSPYSNDPKFYRVIKECR